MSQATTHTHGEAIMESTIYRGIEIRTGKKGEIWLQTQTKKAADAYAATTGDMVTSHIHTIGWMEGTVEEIKPHIDDMLNGAADGDVIPAIADEGTQDELAEINDEGIGMAAAMEYADELDRGSRIETTDRPLARSLRDIMAEKARKAYHVPNHFLGTWSKDPVTDDWLAHIKNANVAPGDKVTIKTKSGKESTHTVDFLVANGRNGGWRCSVR